MDTITEISESAAITTYRVSTPHVWSGHTAFQKVDIADSPEYGRLLFLNGELQSASSDEFIYHECLVHPVMASAGSNKARVLVVGGGEGATVREVLRWEPIEVVWVDIDSELVDLCKEHLDYGGKSILDPRVVFLGEDIQTALPRLGRFDVIILDLPDPDGETGWLYSSEFFAAMLNSLQPKGALVTHCGPVRPIPGQIGDGFYRIWEQRHEGLPGLSVSDFYSIGIPSFQGDWGFWMWRADGARAFPSYRVCLPEGFRCVDEDLIVHLSNPTKLWRIPLNAATRDEDE